jgi:hypothetical protein
LGSAAARYPPRQDKSREARAGGAIKARKESKEEVTPLDLEGAYLQAGPELAEGYAVTGISRIVITSRL